MATALITGANRGIGLELCRHLSERGDRVIAACRRASPDLEGLGVRVIDDVDVSSDDSVRSLAQKLEGERIDVLVNNAGILEPTSLENLDWDAIRRQFEVNSLGPLRVTQAVLPALADGAKIAIITSRMGSIGDNGSGGSYGYRMSKAAVNMAGASLAVDLKPRGIAVALLHPGFVRTDMVARQGHVEPADAAAQLIQRIDELTVETSGGFWHANGETLPW